MERERGSKVIAIVALCVGVVGLSLGFAAFSSQLAIKSSATVTPDAGEFSVVFANAQNPEAEGGATASAATIGSDTVTGAEGETITRSTITLNDVKFTAPGQKVTYTFDASNTGKYIAYLNSVEFKTAEGGAEFVKCTAKTGTDQAKVDSACDDITLTLSVDGTTYEGTDTAINSKDIAIGGTEEMTVVIEYAEKDANILADGEFEVAFGEIELVYSSVD